MMSSETFGRTVQLFLVDEEFIVLEGSQALINTGFAQQSYGGLKQKLISDGVLVALNDEMMAFAKPYLFQVHLPQAPSSSVGTATVV